MCGLSPSSGGGGVEGPSSPGMVHVVTPGRVSRRLCATSIPILPVNSDSDYADDESEYEAPGRRSRGRVGVWLPSAPRWNIMAILPQTVCY